ncbi:M23 family metallopeptidase [Cohnella hashimotonis]|uniref:M23 family metallopeptidase n=1 Tax=Cohnella hashimotonis TaxID=2826895 RepID=A0ABT6TTU0_9BACL|nr:M23 family metallopeptidase [Cohnella hashimotonis]MDI4650272.1 M23 family metallopeptidase [Cohnella hashimotonis]
MNDSNKPNGKIDPSSTRSVVSSSSRPSAWKRFFAKRWVFPAMYMAAAAIIVTILWLNASSGTSGKPKDEASTAGVQQEVGADGQTAEDPDALPVAASGETLAWPVTNRDAMSVAVPYYNQNGTEEEQAAAMVQYDNKFVPHTAIDLASKDGKAFDVKAAMSGEVTVAEQTPQNGYEINIKHPNGLVTVYQSLAELKVKVGDSVKQGDVLGTAGVSELEKNEGVHVHFAVKSNSQTVDPASLIEDQQ